MSDPTKPLDNVDSDDLPDSDDPSLQGDMANDDGWQALMSALGTAPSRRSKPMALSEHPNWAKVKERKLPKQINFYYINQSGDEAYWENATVIKLDIPKRHLMVEGRHGDPLVFDFARIQTCRNAQTGDLIQNLFDELKQIWLDCYGND